jgi:NADPH:quinone reductase
VRAIVVSRTGGPETLVVEERPDPTPGPGEVIVDAEAVGVNFLDVSLRAGRRPTPLPFIPGHEGAGTVSAVAPGVDTVTVGTRVAWAWPGIAASYAERVAIPAEWLVHLPAGISAETAAAALIQGMTARYLTRSAHAIRPGDFVLVHAGAGGVGLLLTQMAKLAGGRVITTVSTPEKEALSRENGADHVIRYDRVDFADEIARITNGRGVTVIYDGVGAATFDGDLSSLAPRGVLVVYGQASGPIPPFDTTQLISAGSVYLTRTSLTHYAPTPGDLGRLADEVLDLVRTGDLTIRIGGRYPLANASEAHADLEGRRSRGKLILLP